ncbi:MAG: hypothetical protein AAGJ46_07095 [Planctomycetota bacterium]
MKQLAAALAVMTCVATHAVAVDTAFVDALRRRGLDRLAEIETRRQLATTNLDPRAIAEWTVVLSRIEVDRAIAAPTRDRAEHWRAADERLAPPSSLTEDGSRLLLAVQSALNAATRGEVEQLETAAGRASDPRAAARALGAADRKLESVAEQMLEQRNVAEADPRDRGPFTPAELESLASRLSLRRAETLWRLARCFEPKTADRDDALLRGVRLARDLTRRDLPDELAWPSRLTLAGLQLEMGRGADALATLVAAGPPPAAWRAEATAARWRTHAVLGQSALAARALASLSDRSPAGALALLEDATARWRSAAGAKRLPLADDVRRRLARGSAVHGPLWRLEAEAAARDVLLEGAAKLAGSSAAEAAPPISDESLAGLIANAEYLYRAGRRAQAIDAYDRAAAAAFRTGARGRSFELQLAAAAISQAGKQWSEAARRFRRAALANVTHPSAAGAHRAAVVSGSQALRADGAGSDTAKAWSDHFDLLEEHLRTWPDAESAEEVRWWRLQAHAARERWQEVLEGSRVFDAVDARRAESIALRGRAWSGLLKASLPESPARRQMLDKAVSDFQAEVLDEDSGWPGRWSPAQRRAALAAAELKLQFAADRAAAAYAERMLQAATAGKPAAEESWRRDAAPLHAAAHVRLGDLAKAEAVLGDRLPTTKLGAKLLLDELLKRVIAGQADAQPAGRVTLRVLNGVEGDSNAAWRLAYRSAALDATGQAGEALAAARRFAEESPNSAEASVRLATLLADQPGEASKREALNLWRTIESRSPGGSSRWFAARLARLRLMSALGQRAEAIKLLQLTKVLYPKLGGDAEAFDQAIADSQ